MSHALAERWLHQTYCQRESEARVCAAAGREGSATESACEQTWVARVRCGGVSVSQVGGPSSCDDDVSGAESGRERWHEAGGVWRGDTRAPRANLSDVGDSSDTDGVSGKAA